MVCEVKEWMWQSMEQRTRQPTNVEHSNPQVNNPPLPCVVLLNSMRKQENKQINQNGKEE